MGRREKIRDYMEDRFLVEFGEDVTPDTDLFKAGVMDSFGYLQLMDFLESEFGVKISSDEILGNIFVSLATIDDFMAEKIELNA
ncbi:MULTISPECIES: acyl carrier protein [Streptomyces]|uniref:acyl carrier protein n=1 Tax=Streptomyces TaxID=1883 RepID=UPI001F364611|nr:acyl carrier protein [Streptomyces noursei]MCE4946605.1 acyl carrier protein [Streptomyces noursei]